MVRVHRGRWPSWRLLNDGERLDHAGLSGLKSGSTQASPVLPASWTTRTGCPRRPGSSDPRGVLPPPSERAADQDGEPGKETLTKDHPSRRFRSAERARGCSDRIATWTARSSGGCGSAGLSGINRPPPKANSIRANQRICMTFSVGRRSSMNGPKTANTSEPAQTQRNVINRRRTGIFGLLEDQSCRVDHNDRRLSEHQVRRSVRSR
jgi:hypothetical protein